MRIRKATLEDAKSMKEIADSFYFTLDDNLDRKSGFFEYKLALEDYVRKLGEDSFSFVAEDNEIMRVFCFVYLSDENFREVYINQFAVRNPGRTLEIRISDMLVSELIRDAKEKEISKLKFHISHSPWRNHASINFAKKFGAVNIGEELKNGVVLGVYEIVL